jgi:hypothetical protein
VKIILAGPLANLGNSWLTMLGQWGDRGLQVALTLIVVVTVCRKFSLKAGIGALLAMVIALGIYNSRSTLANLFQQEVNNPVGGSGAITAVVEGHTPPPLPGVRGGGA